MIILIIFAKVNFLPEEGKINLKYYLKSNCLN